MRKIDFWEALRIEHWGQKYVIPAIGIIVIITGFIPAPGGLQFLWGIGGIFLLFPFYDALITSRNMVVCPGRERKKCNHLINKWHKYCRHCGRENELAVT